MYVYIKLFLLDDTSLIIKKTDSLYSLSGLPSLHFVTFIKDSSFLNASTLKSGFKHLLKALAQIDENCR